jgi:hypothetical protein
MCVSQVGSGTYINLSERVCAVHACDVHECDVDLFKLLFYVVLCNVTFAMRYAMFCSSIGLKIEKRW